MKYSLIKKRILCQDNMSVKTESI